MADTLNTQELAELRQLYKDLQNIQIPDMSKFIDALGGVEAARKNLVQMRKEFANLNSDATYFAESLTKVLQELKNQNNALGKTKSAYSSLSSIANKLKYDQDGISRLSEKELKKMSEKLKQNKQSLNLAKQINEERIKEINRQLYLSNQLDPKRVAALRKERKILQEANQESVNFLKDIQNGYIALEGVTNKRIQREKELQNSIGLTGNALKALNKIPGISGALDTEQALEDMREFAEELKDRGENIGSFSNKLRIAGKGLQTAFGGLKKSLTDPVTILTFFVTKALEANSQAVELGKSLGYGVDRADAFREKLVQIESISNNLNVNTTNLVEAFNELSQATGFSYEFTADQLETQIKLTKQVGLQADEAAQIQKFSILTSKTSEQTYKSFVRGLNATSNQLKVGINFKATLAEALKVSGQLAANLGYNPERIAKAIVTAKAFGMTLEQVAKSGEALLNFESSIENELKAELLTGKQLNLERARAAALAGDQATLAEELAKNIGSSTDFTKMNVLQQKALAESVGMTADELANTLVKREQALASGKSLAQITEEERLEALERQTIQDKFNAAVIKLQSIIGNLVAGPLGSFLDSLTDGLSVITKIAGFFGKIAGFIKSIPGVGDLLGGIASAAAVGTFVYLITKSLTKGTIFNPMIVKDVSSVGGGGGIGDLLGGGSDVTKSRGGVLGRLKQAYKGGGLKGAGKSLSRMVKPGRLIKGAGKVLGKGSVGGILGGLALDYGAEKAAEAGNKNLAKGLGIGSGALSGAGIGAMIGSIIPGVGTAIGAGVGGVIGGLGALFSNDNEETQEVEDGIAPASLGPFKIKDKFGKTAITKTGDGLAVSPNINSTPALDLTPMIAAINEVKTAVDRLYNKDTSINMDGKKIGTTLVQGSYKVA